MLSPPVLELKMQSDQGPCEICSRRYGHRYNQDKLPNFELSLVKNILYVTLIVFSLWPSNVIPPCSQMAPQFLFLGVVQGFDK